jgi:uncharacterized OB-fold protein
MTEPVTGIVTPIRLDYRYTPGTSPSKFLRGMKEGRILGQRCAQCAKVYVPPRGSCPMCGSAFSEEVEVKDTGTLVTFAIVNVNFANRVIDLPYVSGEVLFDGSDTTSMVLVQGASVDDVRMGMRVKAHWLPKEQWDFTFANIDYVEPTGEPDAEYDDFKEYV